MLLHISRNVEIKLVTRCLVKCCFQKIGILHKITYQTIYLQQNSLNKLKHWLYGCAHMHKYEVITGTYLFQEQIFKPNFTVKYLNADNKF